MEKLSLEKFLEFTKDIANNEENFKTWGLYPNEDPNPATPIGNSSKGKGKTNNGSYNY